MHPTDLQPGHFNGYPPEAKSLVIAHIETLRQLPLSFVPSLLREIIDYDYKFPAERSAIDKEFATLSSLSQTQIRERFQAFAQVTMPSALEHFDWVSQPSQFVEQQSAYLWKTHQLDAFRKAATDYGAQLNVAMAAESILVRRLGIAVIGQGVASHDGVLFRNLRPYGTYFGRVKPDKGLELLLARVEQRAREHPVPFGHWYVDGGQAADHGASLTSVSYKDLEPVRSALLAKMQAEIGIPGMGPEELRTRLARLVPSDLGMDKAGDAVLDRFQVRLFTEGSGTQIFSTTFAQWTAREVLRRAQALTLLVRFAPRQRQRPMNELLSNMKGNPELDPVGSLIDADMAAYYHWINQQRLPGSEKSSFVVWFEGHRQALVICPSLPKETESSTEFDLGELLSLAMS
jgi:hypothetical protein